MIHSGISPAVDNLTIGSLAIACKTERIPFRGYLSVTTGEYLKVLHVGTTAEEENWIYATRHPCVANQDDVGWLHRDGITPINNNSSAVVTLTHGSLAIVDITVPLQYGEYLSAPLGQIVKILHVGTTAEEQNWIYAQRHPCSSTENNVGWLPRHAITGYSGHSDCHYPLHSDLETLDCKPPMVTDWEKILGDDRIIGRTKDNTLGDRKAKASAICSTSSASSSSPSTCVRDFARDKNLQKTVHIFSFGLETFDDVLSDACDKQGGGARAQVCHSVLRGLLEEKVENARFHEEVAILADCRQFADPAKEKGCRSLCGHVGWHPQIMSNIANHRNFPGFIRWIKKELELKLLKSDEVRIACFCKSGRHRSVAITRFLKHLVTKQGWACSVKHFAEESGHWNRLCLNNCRECESRSEAREEAYRIAESCFRSRR